MTLTAIRLKPNRRHPSIPSVGMDLRNHTEVLSALKESVEVGKRDTADLLNSYVRVKDLVDMGFATLQSGLLVPEEAAAEDVTYDPTTSGLYADNVQEAIDELAAGGGGGGTDDQTAAEVPYDNASSGLAATDVQAAIDEIVGDTVAQGTSFPGSPSTGDKFYRTDRLLEYYYDGTRWLSTQQFFFASTFNVIETSSTSSHCANPWYNIYQVFVESVTYVTRNEAATPASNYFAFSMGYVLHGNTTGTTIASGQTTQNETVNQYRAHVYSGVDTEVPLDAIGITFSIAETGAASSRVAATAVYRLIG